MIQGSFQLTADDLVSAYWLNWKRSFRNWRGQLVFVVLTVAAFALYVWATDPCADWWDYTWAAVVVIGFYGLFSAVGWPLIKLSARKSWKQSRKFWVKQDVDCTPEHIEFRSHRGVARFAWDDFHRWAADHKVLVLYQSSNALMVVPLENFQPGAIDAITDWLKAAGVKER